MKKKKKISENTEANRHLLVKNGFAVEKLQTEVWQEHFTIHTKFLKETFPQPLARRQYKAVVFFFFSKHDLLYKALRIIWLILIMGQKEKLRSVI